MPRDGAGTYSHPFPDVVEGTTIESAVFNGNTSDVEQDLNTPRPIVAGGTGATNARDAMINLGGELANQNVTNYDSFPFVAGSFSSTGGSTGEPVAGKYFAGICYKVSDAAMILEGRVIEGGVPADRWMRRKWGGWEPWAKQSGSEADLDARYVNVTGDTMTGRLTFPDVSGIQYGNGTTAIIGSAAGGYINFYTGNALQMEVKNTGVVVGNTLTGARVTATNDMMVYNGAGAGGTLYFGNGGTKYLTYDGTNFTFAGGPIINSAQGNVFGGPASAGWATPPTVGSANIILYNGGATNWAGIGCDTGGSVWIKTGLSGSPLPALAIQSTDQAVYATSMLGVNKPSAGYASRMIHDAANTFQIESNATQANYAIRNGGNGYYWIRNDTGYTGGANQVTLANLSSSGNLGVQNGYIITGSPGSSAAFTANSTTTTLGWFSGYYFQINTVSGQLNYVANNATAAFWTFAGEYTIANNAYKPGGGPWLAPSDIRIKNVLGDYNRGLDDVAALHPVYYTYKGNDTTEPPAYPPDMSVPEEERVPQPTPTEAPYPNSIHGTVAKAGTKYTGLIAQEVETVFPEMVTKRSGYIDGEAVDDMRDLDTTPLVFALVNAVKELKARIEVLEGGPAPRRR